MMTFEGPEEDRVAARAANAVALHGEVGEFFVEAGHHAGDRGPTLQNMAAV